MSRLFFTVLRQGNAADGHIDLGNAQARDGLDAGLDIFLHVLRQLEDVLPELGDNVAVDAQRARFGGGEPESVFMPSISAISVPMELDRPHTPSTSRTAMPVTDATTSSEI